jgi:hypothetical protein
MISTAPVWCSAAVASVADYAGPVPTPERPSRQALIDATVRDPLADWSAVLEARRRPMSERLALALSWNKLASELRAGLAAAIERERREAHDEASLQPVGAGGELGLEGALEREEVVVHVDRPGRPAVRGDDRGDAIGPETTYVRSAGMHAGGAERAALANARLEIASAIAARARRRRGSLDAAVMRPP